MRRSIIIFIGIFICCIVFFITTAYAQAANAVTNFDYEEGRIVLSIASLLGLIGLSVKLGQEIQLNNSHRKDTNLHYPRSEQAEALNTITQLLSGYRKKEECQTMHDSTLIKVDAIQTSINRLSEQVARLEEKISIWFSERK